MMRLTRKRLEMLKLVADQDAIWVNSSFNAWPVGDHPRWALDQFGIANELIRLALIGIGVEARSALEASNKGGE